MIMSMTTEKEVEIIEENQYVLGPTTRCDQCSAEALVLVKGVNGELMFCKHHYEKNESALSKFAYETVDERDKLTENRLVENHN
jgi:hypothetical protein